MECTLVYKIHTICAIIARNCRIEKHSKCKMEMCCRCEYQHIQPTEHTLNIFISRTHIYSEKKKFCHEKTSLLVSFLSVHKYFSCGHRSPFPLCIRGCLNCPSHALYKFCNLEPASH